MSLSDDVLKILGVSHKHSLAVVKSLGVGARLLGGIPALLFTGHTILHEVVTLFKRCFPHTGG